MSQMQDKILNAIIERITAAGLESVAQPQFANTGKLYAQIDFTTVLTVSYNFQGDRVSIELTPNEEVDDLAINYGGVGHHGIWGSFLLNYDDGPKILRMLDAVSRVLQLQMQMDWHDVLGTLTDMELGEVHDGNAGGTVIVRLYLEDGRNVIVTDGDSHGEPFSGDEPASKLFLGLYASTAEADDGALYTKCRIVPATRDHLTAGVLTLTGIKA